MRDRLEGFAPIVSSPSENSRVCPTCGTVYGIDTDFCPKDGSKLEESEQLIAGRFVLKARIGLGNMGTVHRAVQLPMGRQVAVKLLHADLLRNPEMVARFEREALAASTVDHPNAITIYDSGRTENGQVYIAMEYLDGESLAAMLSRERSVTAKRALELWVPVVKAMVVAHRKGIVHRDLKPDNVFISRKVSEEGHSEEVVKVLDFGIAKLLQQATGPTVGRINTKTLAGTRLGTALYMAPEQLEGREAGKHSDVYALGLILIEMMTGRLPWGRSAEEADTVMTMMRLVTPPKPLRELAPGKAFSNELQQFFDDVLAIDPARRPQDAGELLKRIARVPEAKFLARPSGSRSDISLMMSASFSGSSVRSDEVSLSPEAQAALNAPSGNNVRPPDPATQPLLPARPQAAPTEPLLPRAKPIGGLDTVKRDVPAELVAGGDLPSLATAITNKPASNDAIAPVDGSATVEFVRPVDRGSSDAIKTMPQPMPAPKIDSSPATQPLMVARLPIEKIRSAGQSDSATLETTRGRSSETMRSRRRAEPNPVWLGLAVALAIFFIGISYVFLHSGRTPQLQPPKPQPVAPTTPVTNNPTPEAKTPTPPSEPVKTTTSDVEPPPSGREVEAPSENPDKTDKSDKTEKPDKRRRSKSKDKEKGKATDDEEIVVTFRMKKPGKANLSCGGELMRSCDGSCSASVFPGTQCLFRTYGFSSKRYKYDEIGAKARRGKAKIDVVMTEE